MSDTAALLPVVLSLLFKSAQNGTLIEIVETTAKLVRLLEPLIADLPPQGGTQPQRDPA